MSIIFWGSWGRVFLLSFFFIDLEILVFRKIIREEIWEINRGVFYFEKCYFLR